MQIIHLSGHTFALFLFFYEKRYDKTLAHSNNCRTFASLLKTKAIDGDYSSVG
jgi:hypothetical protein